MDVVLVAHQPAYLPWHGYFSRLLDVRRLLLLDHVQFAERGWQHRNYLRDRRGRRVRLTVPVSRHFGQPINAVRIADPRFARRHWTTIQQCYHTAPFWDDYRTDLAALYGHTWAHLADLNIALTRLFLDALHLPVALQRSSTLAPTSRATAMLADLCAATGTTVLRVGTGARHYLDHQMLTSAGITVEIADYRHPPYPQGPGPFVPELSILDALLHVGPATVDLLQRGAELSAWTPQAAR
jgi:hypothetical protein